MCVCVCVGGGGGGELVHGAMLNIVHALLGAALQELFQVTDFAIFSWLSVWLWGHFLHNALFWPGC